MHELGMTQRDLMKPLGVTTRGAVGHILTGRRHVNQDQLAAVAKTLKCSTDWLLSAEGMVYVAEPAPLYMTSEDLLAQCIRKVDELLTELKYPKKHPIWTEKYRSQLTAHAYRMALEREGRVDERDLREKIRLVARVA